jgi:hypothetical protein
MDWERLSFFLVLIVKPIWDTTSTVIEIETAFQHGNLDEEISMDIPMDLSTGSHKKLLQQKTIYDALIDVLKVIGFEGSKSDP